MSLLEKLKAAHTTKVVTMSESTFFNVREVCPTEIPIINIALSGTTDGGVSSGLEVIAGESKRFKTLLGLLQVKAFLKKHEDGICILYDSEFGLTPGYVSSMGIPMERVIHIPVEHIEQLKFDIVKRLESIDKKDKLIILIDSIGSLASKKESDDALSGNTAADMTRAKQLKGFFRIITPTLTIKNVACIAINHVYKEQGLYPKDIVSGGQGVMLAANTVWIIGKSQEKEGTEIVGWNFTINVEKSRFVKEKSKLTFQVLYDSGIQKYSGLMDIALDGGFVIKPSNGWYSKKDEDKKYRLNDTDNSAFWEPIIASPDFQAFVAQKYQLAYRNMFEGSVKDE